MKILAVDTSAKVTSVSIINDTQVLSEFNIDTKLTHSQTLMPMLYSALDNAKLSLNDIDGFAVSCGPGSFTGLRIGIGAIKGLSYATNKPCVGVSTLKALAYNLKGVEGIVCAVMDARCNQVYTATFNSTLSNMERLTEDEAITIDELIGRLKNNKKNVFFVGDGADLCYNKLKECFDNIYIADIGKKYQKASMVGVCALEEFKIGNTQTAAELSPVYLRLPQAQRERLARMGKL